MNSNTPGQGNMSMSSLKAALPFDPKIRDSDIQKLDGFKKAMDRAEHLLRQLFYPFIGDRGAEYAWNAMSFQSLLCHSVLYIPRHVDRAHGIPENGVGLREPARSDKDNSQVLGRRFATPPFHFDGPQDPARPGCNSIPRRYLDQA
jgi:hypothetical protein